ncbi:MAG: serine/threonine-protein kinase [Polyangiaceae bacterium]
MAIAQRAAAGPYDDGQGDAVVLIDETLPRQFGKYTLLRKLAAGGMAELFLALHRSVAGFEKLIVIKRILPSMNSDQGFIDMLLHEARIAATLSHPNIVQIFDVGQIEGKYFIAMEHIHGEDIRSIVRAMKKKSVNEFPLEHTLSIVLGVCAGLAYAHDKRDLDGKSLDIVHRDISPQNIVITFTGDVKIVDFGIAKSGSQQGEDTKDGQLKGKVPYMSPEQAAGEQIDWRSDIFAAGVMLFELTTGKRLFKGASEYETLKLICDKEYPRPSQVRPGYPAALEAVVMKALSKSRDERYQSAREMQGDLEAFVREERIACSQVSLTKWMSSLFEEKLAQQKEALQDIKQLADVIAAQVAERGSSTKAPSPPTPAPAPPPARCPRLARAASRSRGAVRGVRPFSPCWWWASAWAASST